MSAELVRIASFPTRPAADLAASQLQAAGIPAHVRADDAGGVLPVLQLTGGAHLLVPADQRLAARELLASAGVRLAEPGEPTRSLGSSAILLVLGLALLVWLLVELLDDLG